MWVKRSEYKRLRDCEEMNHELLDEVNRLSGLITGEVKDCSLGPWCKDCSHLGVDEAVVHYTISAAPILNGLYIKNTAGRVEYCKKHLHEICPEFEMKG